VELHEVAVELYALAPAQFTAARNEAARRARRDGDRGLAAELAALPRPTAAAWAVNLLVRQERAEIEQLLELGGALREAQRALTGEDLRALNRQQHQLLLEVRRRAERAARVHGHPLSGPVAQHVQATLHAAMADPAAADAVRTGLLVADLESTGFGPVDVAGAVAGPRPHLTSGAGSGTGSQPGTRARSAGLSPARGAAPGEHDDRTARARRPGTTTRTGRSTRTDPAGSDDAPDTRTGQGAVEDLGAARRRRAARQAQQERDRELREEESRERQAAEREEHERALREQEARERRASEQARAHEARRELERAEQVAAQADAAVRSAAEHLAGVTHERTAVADELREIETRLDELRRRDDDLAERESQAHTEVSAADQAARDARREVDRTRRAASRSPDPG
jgi:hypothetical protein